MIICPKCGRYCNDNSMICGNCGATLPAPGTSAPAAAGGFAAASFGQAASNPGGSPYANGAPQPNPGWNNAYPPQQPYPSNPYPQQPAAPAAPVRAQGPEVGAGGKQKMPSKGLHLTLTILGFILGILWGILCMGPYKAMCAAIENGSAEEANKNAKKVRTFFIIGMVINVLAILGKIAQGSAQ